MPTQIRDRRLEKMYKWSVKYAQVNRNRYVEVDDMAHEIMCAILMKKQWKNEEYAKQSMRNKLVDLIRKGKITEKYHEAIENCDENCFVISDEDKLDAKMMVAKLLENCNQNMKPIFNQIMNGNTIDEVTRLEKISRRTIHRYLSYAREFLSIR